MARLSKMEIREIAEDLDAMQATMDETTGDSSRESVFYENLGAYFYMMKKVSDLGVSAEVFNARKSLKEVAA